MIWYDTVYYPKDWLIDISLSKIRILLYGKVYRSSIADLCQTMLCSILSNPAIMFRIISYLTCMIQYTILRIDWLISHCGKIWYDMIWYDTIWHDMIWYGMIQYTIQRIDWLISHTGKIWYDTEHDCRIWRLAQISYTTTIYFAIL